MSRSSATENGGSAIRAVSGLVLFAAGLYVFYAGLREAFLIPRMSPTRLGFVSGMAVYLLAHRFIGTRDFFDTFTHELTHTIASMLSGGRPKEFLATDANGGHASLTRVNAFVVLAPYSVPLWALMGVLAFRLLLWVRAAPFILPFVTFYVGLSFMHHLLCQFYGARPYQTDLQRYGHIFSYGFIVFVNALVLGHIFLFTMYQKLTWSYFFVKIHFLLARDLASLSALFGGRAL